MANSFKLEKYRMSEVEQNYSILFYGRNVYKAIESQSVRKFSDLWAKKTVRRILIKFPTLIELTAI